MPRRFVVLASVLGFGLAVTVLTWWALREPAAGSATPAVDAPRALEPPVHSDDAAPVATPATEPQPSEATPSPAARLHGTVRDDLGRPLKTFEIVARPVRSAERAQDVRHAVERAFATQDGSYELSDLGAGPWSIHARGDGESAEQRVELAGIDTALDFVVPRVAKLAGRVEDPYGRAVPRARVCLLPRTAEPSASARALDADDDGRFSFDELPPGTLAVEAAASGWAASPWLELTLSPGMELGGVRIAVRHAARLRVLALDDAGEPEAAREIALAGVTSCASSALAPRSTDASGRAEFPDLAPGRYQLARRASEIELAASGTRAGSRTLARLAARSEIELREGETLEVVLGGKPEAAIRLWGVVAGAERMAGRLIVEASAEFAQPAPLRPFSNLDEHGSYEILLDAPGAYQVAVIASGGPLSMQRVEVVTGSDRRLDFELGAASMRGRAVDDNGAPIAAVEVTLTSSDANVARRAEADADGVFTFAGLPAGTYELAARAPRTHRAAGHDVVSSATRSGLVVAFGERLEDIELRFGPGAALEVEVSAPTGPLANVRVRVVDARGVAPDVRPARWTDAQGRTRIEGLAAGAWFVQALDERFACAWNGPFEIAAAETGRARLELVPGAMLTIEVRGASAPGTWLIARDARGFELAREWVRAGERAPAELGPLPLGRITLLADDERGHTRTVEIGIDSPRPPTVELDLAR